MAVQNILTRIERRNWLGCARDDLRLCAGLIANGAGRLAIEQYGEAATMEQVRASACWRAMAVERGQQVADILLRVWSPDVGDAGRPASMCLSKLLKTVGE